LKRNNDNPHLTIQGDCILVVFARIPHFKSIS